MVDLWLQQGEFLIANLRLEWRWSMQIYIRLWDFACKLSNLIFRMI